MPSFIRMFKRPQKLDIKDTPGLMYPPSTISLMSQSPISISLRRRMATIAFMLHFCRRTGAPLQGCYFPHFQRAALLAARRDLHLQISVLPAASGDAPALSPSWTWPAPIIPSHPPSRTCPRCSQAYQAPTRARILSSPSFQRSPTQSTHAPEPPSPQRIISVHPTDIRAAQPTARPTAGTPIPLSLGLGHVPRSWLPSSHASRSASAPLRSVRSTVHLELSADDADACAPHLTALASTRSCSPRRPALSHLTLLYAFFDHLLVAPARARLTHLTLPHFVGVPSASAPRLAVLDSSPGLVAALAPGRPFRRVTLPIASTVYDAPRCCWECSFAH
ncbi:hypothetical protein EDB86DRAFT_3080179 [Lactarius hatsudake]|nr:hypothetical protein EDB86DRAFT_3080179 [Lactarius hatsudake]